MMIVKEDWSETVDKILKKFDKIDETKDAEVIKFVEQHYDLLIKSDVKYIRTTGRVANVLLMYIEALDYCDYWSTIINKRDQIIAFIEPLRGKRSDFNELYCDIELAYCDALIQKGKNYKLALIHLKELNKLCPRNEGIGEKITAVKQKMMAKYITVAAIIILIALVAKPFFS